MNSHQRAAARQWLANIESNPTPTIDEDDARYLLRSLLATETRDEALAAADLQMLAVLRRCQTHLACNAVNEALAQLYADVRAAIAAAEGQK